MSLKYVQTGVTQEKYVKMRDRAYAEQITLSDLLEKAFDFYEDSVNPKRKEASDEAINTLKKGDS